MNNKSFSLILLFAALCFMQSCKKELNALPENSRVDVVAVTDAKSAETTLNGVYYAFANASALRTDWSGHERTTAQLSGYMDYGYGSNVAIQENRNVGLSAAYWDYSYKLLNAANGMLNGIEKLADNAFTGDRKKEIIGETQFLRAYAHFKLLSYYAEWFDINSELGVLIRDQPSTKGNIEKKRSTVKESYDFILADLDYAIANAAETRPNHYATKWAAMVLKMRVLMSRGGAGDYTEVISLADNIMQNSPYQLEPNTMDLFRTKGLTSTEVILGLKPQANQHITTSNFYSRSRQYWPGASALYVATARLQDLLQDDPRGTWMVGDAFTGLSYATPNTFYFTKYIAQGADPSVASETYYAMRLSEVYLLKAEAIIRSGGNLEDAKTSIKEVMSHAGVTDFSAIDNAATPNDLLIQLYYEISKSLVAEDGQEWMALLRLDFSTVQQIKPTITSKIQYILPIPHTEFVYNPVIGDQNTGYDK